MNSVINERPDRALSLLKILDKLKPFYKNGVTEISSTCNAILLYENDLGWHSHFDPTITDAWIKELGNAIAAYSSIRLDVSNPSLDADLPNGERINIVIPPLVEIGRSAFTIRIPDTRIRVFKEYEDRQYFSRVQWFDSLAVAELDSENVSFLSNSDLKLIGFIRKKEWRNFFQLALRTGKHIAIVGNTGSGKTTLLKTICTLFPEFNRFATIEDVRELFGQSWLEQTLNDLSISPSIFKNPNEDILKIPYNNRISMLYSAIEKNGVRNPAFCLKATNRQKHDNVLTAEIRGAEAHDYLEQLRMASSSTLTSFHATSCAVAFRRLAGMARQHPESSMSSPQDIAYEAKKLLDIVLHVTCENEFDENGNQIGRDRYATQLYFDPIMKKRIDF